ncbi:UNVERIFIED_CONTAM: hypothetical protein HDU68_012394 [Siphonaria sp. JEL0065]|nr:hypothetical protein HDU68_012394 [Siphonaria sp. JEL0065]
MPKIHTPLPQELAEEFTKAASILDHFVKGKTQLDQTLIPPKVIANAKGVAVLTIVKAGFIWSGRAGAGLVVAKLPDGRWSAPSAIAAGGAGVGAQIGAEVTDSVLILNSESAVKAFSHGGNMTFGANLSVAAGPTGRQAEASGSVGNLAPIYSYSKTKGLFAGVSLEGLVILTRKDTNARFYGNQVLPEDLLSGKVEPPAEAEVLYRALNSRGFGSQDRISVTGEDQQQHHQLEQQNSLSNGLKRPASNSSVGQQLPYKAPLPPPHPKSASSSSSQSPFSQPPAYQPPQQQQQHSVIPPRPATNTTTNFAAAAQQKGPPQLPPKAAKHPAQIKTVTAMYDFKGERPGDLGFIVGDKIVVLEEKEDGWWTGELIGNKVVFPINYCNL